MGRYQEISPGQAPSTLNRVEGAAFSAITYRVSLLFTDRLSQDRGFNMSPIPAALRPAQGH